jgi:O-antigen/teichoic acid export membrane protein
MSIALEAPADEIEPPLNEATASMPAIGLKHDSLADSVVVLLVLAAVQRIMGFARGILVCRWLSPDELGQWDMAFGFLTLAAPLTVLGLPGSFGRYVEHFRQRGQLRALVRRTAIACVGLTILAVLTISFARPLVSTIVFGRTDETQLVLFLAGTLAIVIAFNYLTELLTALRMARVAGIVQFFNSLTFAGFSMLLLLAWHREATSLVVAYGIACALQIFWMMGYLRRQLRLAPADQLIHEDSGRPAFWSRLLSFAAWVWVSNLLYNLFDVADRYMIVHTSTADDPLAIVGSYHSSRIVPLLLVSIAGLMGTMILPHLSHDWEAGRRREVSARMNLTLKLLGLLLFVGSITILLASPFLFDVAFQGKFGRGKDAMPWTLTYCTWFGLLTVAQLYLWCAERARLSCLALLIGLVANVILNLLLLPHFGLLGAVWATAVANFTALALIYRFSAWLGMTIQPSMLLVSAADCVGAGAGCGAGDTGSGHSGHHLYRSNLIARRKAKIGRSVAGVCQAIPQIPQLGDLGDRSLRCRHHGSSTTGDVRQHLDARRWRGNVAVQFNSPNRSFSIRSRVVLLERTRPAWRAIERRRSGIFELAAQ